MEMPGEEPLGPLAGLVVVEFASVLMAPLTGQILGDLGADVIKVESQTMDASRLMGPGPHPELSGVAMNLHRNKRSIRLNLRTQGGQNVMSRLVARADVFLTNARPDALTSLGLDYDELSSGNPRLVYCEAHGFRTDGPDRDRPAFDDVMQSETGLPRLQAAAGLGVSYLPSVIADKVAGLTAAYAIMAALVHRASSGEGQRVEVPMFNSVLAFNLVEHLAGAVEHGEPAGYNRILTEHRRPHRTLDGYLAILPYSDEQWVALYEAAGHSDELEHPYFHDRYSRNQHADFVYGSLSRLIEERTTAEWIDLCRQLDIAVAPVPSIDEIVANPRLHRGVIRDADHPLTGRYRQIAPPVVFDRTPATVRRPAPLVGQQTVELLREIGASEVEIESWLASGAVVAIPEAVQS
jgi:crotonobetainyl-CoA:carnitine CoA-transferase CaiB-like acyl-CoA transferase